MAEAKKRFPWSWLACAVLLVILATVLGAIETLGRQGTIIGRFNRLEPGMPTGDVTAILGPVDEVVPKFHGYLSRSIYHCIWHEGPADLEIEWSTSPSTEEQYLFEASYRVGRPGHPLWHVRRWAEKAYTAIHGPRR